MSASLWGRVDVVEYLPSSGVDAKARDYKGRSALDLAEPSRRNDSERERRMVRYREGSEAEVRRRHIAIKLRAVTASAPLGCDRAPRRREGSEGLFPNPATSSKNGCVSYYDSTTRYALPDENKAISRLAREPLFPIISAMSGHSHSGWDSTVLDNAEWTDEVLRLADRLNISIEKRFASHVEKQLVALYVAKHVLLDCENEERVRAYGENKDLANVKPTKMSVEAMIVVSKGAVCYDCEKFMMQLRDRVPLNLTIIS